MAEESVIAALEAAVEASPRDVALRRHLAGLLVAAGRVGDAFAHCQTALADQPDDLETLRLIADCAQQLGRGDQAASYRRLASALDPVRSQTSPVLEHPELTGLPEAGDPEIDALLRSVFADIDRPTTTLADVGGLEEVKQRLRTSFLAPMQNEELRRMYGASLRGGLLLWGPPGCGKTFLGRALAGELGANFFAVGLHDVLDMYLGESERKLHAIFETARRAAPCVVFLDEVDALGMKRSNLARSAGHNVVVQLLEELDGVADNNEGVFVLGATNQPWDVDAALRRPGRFDRTLLVLPPDEPARAAILEYHLRDRPVEPVDVRALAVRTEGFSGADLRLVCESAAQTALEDSIASGRPRPISRVDIEGAIAGIRPSTGAWLDSARSYAIYANDGGDYDELLGYLKKRRMA